MWLTLIAGKVMEGALRELVKGVSAVEALPGSPENSGLVCTAQSKGKDARKWPEGAPGVVQSGD